MDKEFLSIKELCGYLSITRPTLWRMERDRDFPHPIKLLSQKKWRKSEIDEYLDKTREK